MEQPITIGLDLAKSVFQVHGVGSDGATVVRRQLRRSQLLAFFEKLEPCLVGMEASAGAHHWAREFGRLGHEVRLMPPAYVKPYVKRGKTDGEMGPWPQWGRESLEPFASNLNRLSLSQIGDLNAKGDV